MKNAIKLLALVIVALMQQACEKEVQFPVKEKDRRLVIEAEAGDAANSVRVQLSETIGIYEQNMKVVKGATVSIFNETGTEVVLQETQNGLYTTNNLTVNPNAAYTLRVLHNGVSYSAKSIAETEPAVNYIDMMDGQIFGSINLSSTQKKFFMAKAFNDGKEISYPTFFSEEELKNSGDFFLGIKEMDYQSGDTIQVDVMGISKELFNYFIALQNVTPGEFNGFFQVSTPDNPKNNISNKALGYFSAHAIHRTYLIIP
jgi:hypothetical protein